MKLNVVFMIAIVVVACCDVRATPNKRHSEDDNGDNDVIPVCPASHDRAFASGIKCCRYDKFSKSTKNVEPRNSDICPSGDVIGCPLGEGCEDSPPSCFQFFELEGFGKEYDGLYNFDSKSQYEASKQLYIVEPDFGVQGDKCIWWFRPCRRWWLGPCQNIGTNRGFAFIDAEVPCPHPEEERWRNPESGEYFTNIRNYSAERCKYFNDGTAVCGASSSTPLSTTTPNGENAVVVNNRYVEICSSRLKEGQWECNPNGDDVHEAVDFKC